MIIDITRKLIQGTAVWEGDTPFSLEEVLRMAEGSSVNLTTIHMSAHTGTHADAYHHFRDDDTKINEMDLARYWGPAQVVTVEKEHGPLSPEDFAHVDLSLAPRLLVHSNASHHPLDHFPRNFVYPAPELGAWLAQNGIILYGSDTPSMDHVDSKPLPGHNGLRTNDIYILEWLDLSQVTDGLYELSALPLRLVGGDGSPVRAALRYDQLNYREDEFT